MPKLNQKGIVHLLVPMILLVGIIAGTYLVLEGPKIFKPKASEPSVSGPVTYLPAPSNLQVSCSSDNKTVTYSWSSVPGSDKYHVRVNKQPFEVWNPEDKSTGDYSRLVYGNSKTSHYDAVSPNVDYKFSVQALPAGVEYSPQGNLSDWKLFNCGTQASPTPTPTPTPTPLPTPTATPQAAAKRVFVTSTTYNGNLGGLSGADAKCQARANAAGLGGVWKAWLSDSITTAASRLTHSTIPYKLLNETLIAGNWYDLLDGILRNPINVDEKGQLLNATPAYAKVWTNTNSSGYIVDTNYIIHCSNWTTTNAGYYGRYGIYLYTDARWTNYSSEPCSSSIMSHLYCFEQ